MRAFLFFAVVLSFASGSSGAVAADWSQWELDHALAREGDWLVVQNPGNSACFIKQSYDSDPSLMELILGRSGIPALVTPFFQGISSDVVYQVDDRPPGVIRRSDVTSPSSIELPRDIVPDLRAGFTLTVSVTPTGRPQLVQQFSLLGFTAASRWLERDVCQFEASAPASGTNGGTALDISLERGSAGRLHVVGETTLPDGMRIMIGLRHVPSNYLAKPK